MDLKELLPPEFLKDDLKTTYKETDLEFEMERGEELPKTRHYYPSSWHWALNALHAWTPRNQ